MTALGWNRAQFICRISRFVSCFATFPHISFLEPAMGCFISFLFPHLSAHFKLLHVTMVFCFFLPLSFGISPLLAFKLKIKSINQRQWEKDVETEGHLNPFRVPKASEGEINRKLKWSREWQQSFFFGWTESRCISQWFLL